MKKYCIECHGAKKQSSGLRLDARSHFLKGGDNGTLVSTNKSEPSELLRRLEASDEDERMPPPDAPSLSKAEIDLMKRWVEEGANWVETEEDRVASKDPRESIGHGNLLRAQSSLAVRNGRATEAAFGMDWIALYWIG